MLTKEPSSSPIMERSWLICERKWKMLKMRKVLVTNNHDCYWQESLYMTNQMNGIKVLCELLQSLGQAR